MVTTHTARTASRRTDPGSTAAGAMRRPPRRRVRARATRRAGGLGLGATMVLALSSCGSGTPSAGTTTTTAPAVPTTMHEQPGWAIATRLNGVIYADKRTIREPDGAVVTVYRFRAGRVAYVLHVGSEDPPGAAARVNAAHGPALAPGQLSRIVAAFNGGFKQVAASGGFMLLGRVLEPLQRGRASLVIDASGAAHIGTWGGGLPAPGEHVVAVRQNLQLLVANGRPSPVVGTLGAWGATLGNVPNVARSALGQDRSGNLIFAASMHALPQDLAAALVAAGAVRAMELDINPYWVQLESARKPGGGLFAAVPGQEQSGMQYVYGWTRDFVAVVAVGAL